MQNTNSVPSKTDALHILDILLSIQMIFDFTSMTRSLLGTVEV